MDIFAWMDYLFLSLLQSCWSSRRNGGKEKGGEREKDIRQTKERQNTEAVAEAGVVGACSTCIACMEPVGIYAFMFLFWSRLLYFYPLYTYSIVFSPIGERAISLMYLGPWSAKQSNMTSEPSAIYISPFPVPEGPGRQTLLILSGLFSRRTCFIVVRSSPSY